MNGKQAGKLVIISIVLLASSSYAADYKAWFPLIPKTMGGLPQSGEPVGVNMQTGGQSWSSLEQTYAKGDGDKTNQFVIVQGVGSPVLQGYLAMPKLEMESGDSIMKTLQVGGYPGLFSYDKGDKKGNLMIQLGKDMLVVISSEPSSGLDDLQNLAKEVPLAKLAAAK